MRPLGVVGVGPVGDRLAGMVDAEEQGLVQHLATHPAVEGLAFPFCMGFPGAMSCHFTCIFPAHSRIVFEVNSVPS